MFYNDNIIVYIAIDGTGATRLVNRELQWISWHIHTGHPRKEKMLCKTIYNSLSWFMVDKLNVIDANQKG